MHNILNLPYYVLFKFIEAESRDGIATSDIENVLEIVQTNKVSPDSISIGDVITLNEGTDYEVIDIKISNIQEKAKDFRFGIPEYPIVGEYKGYLLSISLFLREC